MKCSIYFGELSETRKQKWEQGDSNPYEVLISPICFERNASQLLSVGYQYFREKIQIDWGSFAWKCTPDEMYRFLDDYKTTLPWLVKRDEEVCAKIQDYVAERGNTEYGVVFVEEM